MKTPAANGRGVETLPGNFHAPSNLDNHDRQAPFADHRTAALALLTSSVRLTCKAGSFLGQLAADPSPMTSAQADWLSKLLERAELPALATGDAA